jgi:hypothetical protein
MPMPKEDLEKLIRKLNATDSEAESLREARRQAEMIYSPPSVGRRLPPAGTVRTPVEGFIGDGFVQINTWSGPRRLLKENIDLRQRGDHPANLVTPWADWNEARERHLAEDRRGDVAAVSGIRAFDYRESPGQTQFALDIARIDYATQLASRDFYGASTERRESFREVLRRKGFPAFLAQSPPPAAVAANINVVSAEYLALLVQRSAAVAVYPSQWNLGINETMKYDDVGEDFIDLVYRGAEEEVGLTAGDIDSVFISWFGFCFDCGNYYLFAHVKSRRRSYEIIDRAANAHSNFEASGMAWLPFEAEAIQSVIERGLTPDGTTEWLHHAPLSADQLWRSRAVIFE